MSQFIAKKSKILLLLIALTAVALSGCTTQRSDCRPSNDLLTKSADLQPATSAEDAPEVMKHNGDVLLGDRDRLARWQAWWRGCEKGA